MELIRAKENWEKQTIKNYKRYRKALGHELTDDEIEEELYREH